MWSFPRYMGIVIALIVMCVILSWLVAVDPLINASKASSGLPLSQHTTPSLSFSPTVPASLIIATTPTDPTVKPTPTVEPAPTIWPTPTAAAMPIPLVQPTPTPIPTYGTTPTPTAVSGSFNPNAHYKLVNVNSGKDLDVTNSSLADGAHVIQFGDKGGTNQRWNIIAVGNAYKLVNVNSGKDLDVTNSSLADDALVIQFGDKGGSNQRWNIVQYSG